MHSEAVCSDCYYGSIFDEKSEGAIGYFRFFCPICKASRPSTPRGKTQYQRSSEALAGNGHVAPDVVFASSRDEESIGEA